MTVNARAPATRPVSSGVASARLRRMAYDHISTATSPRLAAQAHNGHSVGNRESLLATACRHVASILTSPSLNGPVIIHAAATRPIRAAPVLAGGRRGTAPTLATPSTTANQ